MTRHKTPSGRWRFTDHKCEIRLGGLLLGMVKYAPQEPIGQHWEFHNTGSKDFAVAADYDTLAEIIGRMIDESLELAGG